jgi:P27 family predicted phage terminase small subunit
MSVPVPVMRTGRSPSMTMRAFGGERPAETTLTGGGNSFFCHSRETRARRRFHFSGRRFAAFFEMNVLPSRRKQEATMPGPPPTPIQLRLLRGNPGKRPLRAEPEPVREPECPDPPPFVTGYAQDEWWRTAPELHRLGLLTVLDVAALAAYCMAYKLWRAAEETLTRMVDSDPVTHALLVKSMDGNPRRNPLVKIASDAGADMVRYASEFAMTPIARSGLAAGVRNQPPGGGKFHGLLR